MNSLKERLQILIAVLLLGMAVFCIWYLLFYMPARMNEPDGTLVYRIPGKLVRL